MLAMSRKIENSNKIKRQKLLKKEPNGNSGVKKYNRNEKLIREVQHYV